MKNYDIQIDADPDVTGSTDPNVTRFDVYEAGCEDETDHGHTGVTETHRFDTPVGFFVDVFSANELHKIGHAGARLVAESLIREARLADSEAWEKQHEKVGNRLHARLANESV